VNAMPPRRFGAADEAALDRFDVHHPHVQAARFLVARRREAMAQATAVKRALGAPVTLPFLYGDPESAAGIATLAEALGIASDLAA